MKFSFVEHKYFPVVGGVISGSILLMGVLTYFQPVKAREMLRRLRGTAAPEMTATQTQSEDGARLKELQTLQMHLQNKPSHPPILLRMAQLSREMGKLSEAAEHLRNILQQEPDNLDARLELGRTLYESGDIEGAIRETKRIVDKNPKHVAALYNLGAIHANLSNSALASQYWNRAVASDPQSESGRNAQRGLDALGSPLPLNRPMNRSSRIGRVDGR